MSTAAPSSRRPAASRSTTSSGGRSTRSTTGARCWSPRPPDRARRSSPSTRSSSRSRVGGKAFYTTPLKALSNQKYGDFVRVHGAERVGLLTGDNSVNGEAPIVVMTTEVLRNMIYAASPTLDGLRVRRARRGALPPGPLPRRGVGGGDRPPRRPRSTSCACRRPSRTPRSWRVDRDRARRDRAGHRGAPAGRARHRYLVGGAGRRRSCTLLPTFVGEGDDLRPEPRGRERLDRRAGRAARAARPRARGRLRTPSAGRDGRAPRRRAMLPGDRVRLQPGRLRPGGRRSAAPRGIAPHDRRRAARRSARIAEAHTAGLADDDLEVLGYDAWLAGSRPGSPRTTPAWSRR